MHLPNDSREATYRFIRSQLMCGRWQPGHRVSELAISKELGVSRRPVREAVALLAAQGMLHLTPEMRPSFKDQQPQRNPAEVPDSKMQLEPLVVA